MKEFKELHPKEWRTMFSYYLDQIEQNPSQDIAKLIANKLVSEYNYTEGFASRLSLSLIPLFQQSASLDFYTDTDTICFPKNVYKTIASYLQNLPSIKHVSLALAFITYAYKNWHSSGWIRYDRKEIMYLASVAKVSTSLQQQLIASLHEPLQLSMRVIGSNQPIPCFNISWLEYIPQNSEDTSVQWLNLGSYSPQTIKELSELIYIPKED